ncbi:MAG: type IV pilus twitching motility protein PilT [Solirubrobacterales bacterium]|nr:type IV pilus twitching motility protein PilT [Solirubrobacterales bacterium]
MFDLHEALRYVVRQEGSDLHLKAFSPPLARIHGQLGPIEGYQQMEPEQIERVLHEMLTDPEKLQEFAHENEVDFAFAVEGLSRFRVNAFRQRSLISIALRVIPFSVRTIDELGLPPVMMELADEERGLILLTGTTGSGKSTTLAAMIDQINETKARHIVTIEDPIEYLHSDRKSIINQREVGMDTASFARAMRRVLRQDPDVILIGEMRDEETVRSALSAAETGHLVLSTVHTLDASESVNRIIDFFPLHEQTQARAMLGGTLKGVISQRLVATPTREGRVAVCEILRMTGRARDMITDPEQTGRLREVIAEGEYYGMQTFDQALLRHYQAGRVSMEDALRVATSPHDFKLLVSAEGRTSTSMEDLEDDQKKAAAGPETLKRPPGGVSAPLPGSGMPSSAPPKSAPARGSSPPPGVPA